MPSRQEKGESIGAGGQIAVERAEAGSGPGGGAGAPLAPTRSESPRCPACHRSIESDWRACPDCGAELIHGGPRLTPEQNSSALPSMDNGELAFVPPPGGAKRPITFVDGAISSNSGPSVSLSSLVAPRPEMDRIPQETLADEPRRPITVLRADEVEAPLEIPDKARAAVPEATASGTTLAPTVVVMSPEPLPERRIDRRDMVEIERLIGEAVERALRQHAALLAPAGAAALSGSAQVPTSARKHVAGFGAGLLIGGALADILVLNWDVWVRGDVGSAIGWIQQTGIIGMAGVAGAGASALLFGVARGRRRATLR